MAGLSSRFFNAGFQQPKYMLEAYGKTLFEHSVNSFKHYFNSLPFLFIVRDAFDTASFVKEKATRLGIKEFHVEILEKETRGQAETVALGLESLKSNNIHYTGPITIFNIDTFRPNFLYPPISARCDGYLEVFKGDGDNWSFAKPKSTDSDRVIQTAEKNPISDLCSTGLYYFNDVNFFLESFYAYNKQPESLWEKGEIYIAPLYNFLIKKNLIIKYHLIHKDDVIFCGTPCEYQNFLDKK